MARGIAKAPAAEAERKRKISEARKRRMRALGYLNTPETRALMAAAKLGTTASKATRKKMSLAQKGRVPAHLNKFLAAAHASPNSIINKRGPEHPRWRGDEVGYHGVHNWIRQALGSPKKCERCATESAGRYEWANKSREYRRDVSDWERLCVSCHRKDGFSRGEYVPWNKGRKLKET